MDGVAFIHKISQFSPLGEDFIQAFSHSIEVLHVRRQITMVFDEGNFPGWYFVEKGVAASYYYTDGERRVLRFWGPGDCLLSNRGHDKALKGNYVEICGETMLLYISFRQLEELSQEFPAIVSRIREGMYQEELQYSQQRIQELLMMGASERYRRLLERMPDIEQKVSQRMVAAFLGIRPSSLSRIRRQWLESIKKQR